MRSFEKWGVTSRACGKLAALAINAAVDNNYFGPLHEMVGRDNAGCWKFKLPDGNMMMAHYTYHYINIINIEIGYQDEDMYFSRVFGFKLSLPTREESSRAVIHITNKVHQWTPTRGIMADTRTLRHWADMPVTRYDNLYTIGHAT